MRIEEIFVFPHGVWLVDGKVEVQKIFVFGWEEKWDDRNVDRINLLLWPQY